MTHTRIGLTIAASVAAIIASTASRAVEITAGDWKFSATGNVNAHYIVAQCEDTPGVVSGGLACTRAPGQDSTSSSVSNGLLPAALAISASTTQSGYDIAATFGFYPGISTNDASPNLQQGASNINTGLGTTGIDMRQVFLTFGNDRMGTFLLGRNIGLFGQDAILGDMTLIGVGGGGGNYAAPANTSLGSIGLGYIYTDWLAQVDYTTPDISGLKLTLGLFDPLEPVPTPGSPITPVSTPKSSPGFHAKAAYKLGDNLYLSVSGIYQKQKGVTSVSDFNSWGFDAGGKYKVGGLELLGWYYYGKGMGTTALFFNASDGLGHERESDGFLAQVTYKINKTKFGVNYGESNLDLASGEINPTLVQKNDKFTVGIYYSLTENLTLLAEGSQITAKSQIGAENKAQNYNVGAFLSF
ncbi:MAG: porin [Gammaproteobacteria bacterium]